MRRGARSDMRPPDIWAAVLLLSGVLLCGALLWLGYLGGLQTHLWTTDGFGLNRLSADLVREGGSLSDWSLSNSPSYFPDWLLYGISDALTPSPVLAQGVYFTLQFILIGLGCVALFRALGLARVWISAGLVMLALLALSAVPHTPFTFLLFAVFHTSCLMMSIWTLAFALNATRAAGGDLALNLLGLGGFTTLMIASDTLFAVQFVGPVGVTLGVAWLAGRVRFSRLMMIGGVLAAALVAGYVAGTALTPNPRGAVASFDPAGLMDGLREIAQKASVRLGPGYPAQMVAVLAGYAACIWCLLRGGPLRIFAGYTLCVCVINVMVLASFSGTALNHNYFIPCAVLPVIVLAAWIGQILVTPRRRVLGAVLAVPLALGVLFSDVRIRLFATSMPQAEAECLSRVFERHYLRTGVATFWDAGEIMGLSETPVVIAKVNRNLTPDFRLGTRRAYDGPFDFAVENTAETRPDFQLDMEKLRLLNGAPDRVETCGRRRVHVYRGRLRAQTFLGRSGTWLACDLPGQMPAEAKSCSRVQTDGAVGHPTFGPYAQFDPGTYRFTFGYRAASPATDVIGHWDVAFIRDGTDGVTLGSGAMTGTGGVHTTLSGNFTVNEEAAENLIEIRTFVSDPGAGVVIYDLEVRPVAP